MTPDQIIPGHTYRLADGRATRIESIRDGYVFHRELSGSLAMPAVVFASLCVRDITPAPESDQGEKVAQAQSQGPSRGDGGELMPCQSAASVNAELLEACKAALPWVATAIAHRPDANPEAVANHAADLSQLRAAITRAEAANDPPRFRHRRTGDIYELLLIANEHAERTAQYPPTAVYRRLSDRTVWSRPVQDWGKDFEEVTGNE